MTTQRRRLYASPKGDAWFLCRGRGGRLVVLHEPNRSGAKPTQIDIGTFLAERNNGPEHQALLHLIGELVDPAHSPGKQTRG